MKALAITFARKHVILRNAERCTKGNMMKLLMTAGNDAWRNDEKVKTHFGSYAEFISFFMKFKGHFAVTKIEDIHYSKEFGKWHIQSRNWIGNYPEEQIIFADVEENYRPFAPMD